MNAKQATVTTVSLRAKPSRAFYIQGGTEDVRSRIFIFRILLMSLTVLGVVSFILAGVDLWLLRHSSNGGSPLLSLGFVGLCLLLWKISHTSYYKIAVQIFLVAFIVAGTYTLAGWGINLPIGDLIYALVVIMSGILVNSRYAAGLAGILAMLIMLLSWLQSSGRIHPDLSVEAHRISVGDGVSYATLLGVIAVVSWLSNREISRSLKKAQESEIALKNERDNLETIVTERTNALEQTQIEHTLELERFAEFGRVTSGLVHDIASPLTAVLFNLEQLGITRQTEALKDTLVSLGIIQQYLENARSYLRGSGDAAWFEVESVLRQALTILAHQATVARVVFRIDIKQPISIYGDAVLFKRVVANLMINALEAYNTNTSYDRREVIVRVTKRKTTVILSVHDWGRGIPADQHTTIFESFYTTKHNSARNSGLGLGIVKRLVEDHFHGSVKVTSSPKTGTKFTIYLHCSVKTFQSDSDSAA